MYPTESTLTKLGNFFWICPVYRMLNSFDLYTPPNTSVSIPINIDTSVIKHTHYGRVYIKTCWQQNHFANFLGKMMIQKDLQKLA